MTRRDSVDLNAPVISDHLGLCSGEFPFGEFLLNPCFHFLRSDCAIFVGVKFLEPIIAYAEVIILLVLEADGGGETKEAEGSDGLHCAWSLFWSLFCIITLASTAPFIAPRFATLGKLTSQITANLI